MINLLSYRRVDFMKICFDASKAINESKTRMCPEGSFFQVGPPVLPPDPISSIGNKSTDWQKPTFHEKVSSFLFVLR